MNETIGGTSQAPDYNTVTYTERRASWFGQCKDTKKVIWPCQKVWDRVHWNCGGAIVGAPPIQMFDTISDEAYVIRILTKNDNVYKKIT